MSVARATPTHDKRAHPRVSMALSATCERRGCPPLAGVTRDLGIGGTFIECTEPLPFGTEVMIALSLPGATADLRLPGVVRWAKSDGFGVQFGLLGARDTYAISELLKR